MKLFFMLFLLVSSIQSGGSFSRSICCLKDTVIIENIQESPDLEELLEDRQIRKRKSCCRSTCTKIIIGGIGVSAVVIPTVISIVGFINDIKAKAELVEQSCIKMDGHCTKFDTQCHILGSQVQLLIELLAKITDITSEQVICIVKCSTNYTTIIEQLACISGCFKL